MATTTVTTVEPETKFASPILPKSNHSLSAPPDEADDDVVRPDIEWIPSHKTYAKRVEQLKLNCKDRQTTLPEGWPEKLDAARVWSGSDFKDDMGKYILQFEESDIAEIENGLAHFKGLPHNNDPDNVNTETFPLPTLGAKLNDVSKQIHDGIGFAVLRGLDPKKYSPRDNILLYVGITSYIAEVRGCQDYDGRMVVHIQDIREDVRDYAKRGPFSPYTSRAQPFHTDRCDILSLYAYDVSPTGGESVIASGGKIYNEIADKRPDIVHLLADDKWIFDEFHNGDYHRRPLLHKFGSHGPGFVYSRRPLTGAWFSPHHPSVPAMSEEQAEALDTVHFTAEKHQLELRLQRGDIELLNNFALFHARREFVDDPSARRHMIRLWLRNKDYAWESPEVVARSGREIYDPDSPFRANPVWDINWSPPLGRGPWKRMECN